MNLATLVRIQAGVAFGAKSSPTRIRTAVAGFRVLSANHYTMGDDARRLLLVCIQEILTRPHGVAVALRIPNPTTAVRFRLGSPFAAQLVGYDVALTRRRSSVRIRVAVAFARGARIRDRQGSNLRGQSPLDFKSSPVTTWVRSRWLPSSYRWSWTVPLANRHTDMSTLEYVRICVRVSSLRRGFGGTVFSTGFGDAQ